MKHRIKSEFGYTTEQANYELENYADEVMIDLNIWALTNERQDSDAKIAEMKSKAHSNIKR